MCLVYLTMRSLLTFTLDDLYSGELGTVISGPMVTFYAHLYIFYGIGNPSIW